jgi:hypothetical protein
MTDAQMYWAFYAFFLLVRIPATFKRCRIPLMRGPGYFFNTRVPADFFDGPGREILRRYRMWIFAPFLFDAVAVAAIYKWGQPIYLLYLALADVAIAMLNHVAALRRAIREVKPFEVEAMAAPSAVTFSLSTRRLRDYTSFKQEAAIAVLNLAGLARLREGWGAAGGLLFLLYLQAGMLLLKCALIAGRTPLPRENTEQYLEWREAYRRLLTGSCDAVRLMTAGTVLLLWIDVSRVEILSATLVVLGAWVLWYWGRMRRFMQLYARSKPVQLPHALEPAGATPPVVCYLPETPLSFVKGTRGWALNLANRRSQIGVAYLLVLVAVGVMLR